MRNVSILFIAMIVVGLLAVVPHAVASTLAGENPTVAAGETVEDDLFVAGEHVLIEGTVNGDVYAAGDSVTVRGTINGDLLAIGGTITVLGTIRDDMRVAAETVQLVDAEVGDSFSALAASISTTDGGIGGGVLAAGQSISLRSAVGRGVTVAGESLTIASTVGRDVLANVNELFLVDNAAVSGKVDYYSETDAQITASATVDGEINRHQPAASDRSSRPELASKIWSFLASLAVAAAILWLMPAAFKTVSHNITRRPLANIGWGLVALIVTPFLIVAMLITIVGIPLALITTGAYILFLYLAKVFAAYAIAHALFEYFDFRYKNPFLILASGLFLYQVLLLIPVVSWLIRFAALLVGLGAAATYLVTRSSTSLKTGKTGAPSQKSA